MARRNYSVEIDNINNRLSSVEATQSEMLNILMDIKSELGGSRTSKKSVSATKSSSKKSTTSKEKTTQTREERLTEKYGDLDTRKKFVELRSKVADEFTALAKEHDVYIPTKSYRKVLNSTTELLNGKFNKATVKKSFLAAAK